MDAAEVVPAGPAITADTLAPPLRKHVDPKAPVPLRAMGAKLLVPMSPRDAGCLLYLLSFDPDEAVRAQALKSAAAMPEKIAVSTLRDETVPPLVLLWLAEQVKGNEQYAELIALNNAAPDDALVVIARATTAKVVEIIAQNQLRLLRHDPLLRAVLSESQASQATIDSVADFAIRSGIVDLTVPALAAAHRRIHGDKPPDPPGPTAEEVLAEFHELREELPEGEERPLEEPRKLTLTQRILKMSVSQKIKLATLGNKEARGILLRDTNKLVCVAAVLSPRITESEILAITNSRTAHEEVLRVVTNDREWMKLYQVKLNLVKNPKTPLPTALKLLTHIRGTDLKDLQKNKNVPTAIQTGARNAYAKMKPGDK